MPFIKAGELNIHYQIYGKGEPLILIAGLNSDLTFWLGLVNALSRNYQVIIFDNRGVGKTEYPNADFSLEIMADDVAHLCAALRIDSAYFMGHSMGGAILQILAKEYPELVKKAVIINSVAKFDIKFELFMQLYLDAMRAKIDPRSLIAGGLAWLYSSQFLNQPGIVDSIIDLVLSNPTLPTLINTTRQNTALSQFDSRKWLNEIKRPCLFVAGDEDIICFPKQVLEISKQVKGAQYYCFKNCGHNPFIEYPKEFCELVFRFLLQH